MAANSTYIADDLVDEILLKLPLKSIIRFKSVSRQWKSLIESQSFIDRHHKNSPRKILLALDSGCSDGNSPPCIFPGEEEEEEEIFCYIRNCDASIMSLTCDGLICIPESDSIKVCNPATRECRRFPTSEPLVWTSVPHAGTGRIPVTSICHRQRLEPYVAKFQTTTRSSFGFGKDEVTGAYKVVELHAPSPSLLVGDCNVLDLKTGRWRHVSVVPYRIFSTERSVYVNGSVHWFTVDLWEPDASKIVAFDLHVEKFKVVSHPNPSFSSDDYPLFSELLSLQNRLSVSEMRRTTHDLNIWSMVNNIEEERWVKTHSICLCRLYQPRRSSTVQLFTPLTISAQGDGEVLIIWDYGKTLFKSYPNIVLPQNEVSTDARVVASSYIQTLVSVW